MNKNTRYVLCREWFKRALWSIECFILGPFKYKNLLAEYNGLETKLECLMASEKVIVIKPIGPHVKIEGLDGITAPIYLELNNSSISDCTIKGPSPVQWSGKNALINHCNFLGQEVK
jgi:hypothetical protein